MKKYFKLYACCLLTKGASRTTVSDVQRNEVFFIPNALYSILTMHLDKSVDDIKAFYKHENDDIIDEYLAYLIDKELGFYCQNPENFPPINLDWQRPEAITNAIFDMDGNSTYNVENAISSLQCLGCKNLEFRIFDGYTYEKLIMLLKNIEDSIFRFVSILIKYHDSLSLDNIKKLLAEYQSVQNVIIFDAEKEVVDDMITYTTQKVDSSNCCGFISVGYFSPTLELFSESQSYNSCLNRKLSIDVNGLIKNCPSLQVSYGHIDETEIEDVINLTSFQKYWHIKKTQIDTCKVCEFRNICTDCRAFLDPTDELYAKPKKCSYDPNTMVWEN